MSLLTKQERNSLCDSTPTPPTDELEIRKKRIRDTVWLSIMNWVNCVDPQNICQQSLSINIGDYLDESTQAQWTSQLTEAGYTVLIQNNQMLIS